MHDQLSQQSAASAEHLVHPAYSPDMLADLRQQIQVKLRERAKGFEGQGPNRGVNAYARDELQQILREVAARGMCATAEEPEIFFPERGQSTIPAQKECADCSLRAECGSLALLVGEPFGVWGGISAKNRRSMRSKLSLGGNIIAISKLNDSHPVRVALRNLSDETASISLLSARQREGQAIVKLITDKATEAGAKIKQMLMAENLWVEVIEVTDEDDTDETDTDSV